MPSYVDLFILVVIAIFAIKGFFKGFFVEFFSFLGFFVAFFIATNLYNGLGAWVASILKVSFGLAKFAAFLLVFLAIVFAFAAVGVALSKGAKKLKLSGTNRFLGGVFGAAKGALAVGVMVLVLAKGNIAPGFEAEVKKSTVARVAVAVFDRTMALVDL
ncbi:MAG: CvpA family protein [Deltaproteobacteria bacterium]|nr:CvpA family protein [Deltaproteobacteria bacterium]